MNRKKKLPVGPVVVGVCAVAVAAIVFAQTGKGRSGAVVASTRSQSSVDPAVKIAVAMDRKPLTYYTGGVRTDLFNAPLAMIVEKPKVSAKPKKEAIDLSIPTTPAPVNPFSDYAYTGTVNASGKMVALIENTKTKEGQYLKQGDPFMGGTIADVTDRTVAIDVAGKRESLAKTDDFKLTPLDKSAAYLTAAPAQPSAPGMPGMPGAPGQAGGMTGGTPAWMQNLPADAQARIMQRFQNMTPEQRDQMQQRMNNRAFNGGGGRRGGGRGGGGGGFGGGGFGGGGFGG